MKKTFFVFISFLLTIGIPFAVLNIPLFKDISGVDSLSYILGFLIITTSLIIGFTGYYFGTLKSQQESFMMNQKADVESLKENIDRLHSVIQDIDGTSIYTVDRDNVYDNLSHFVKKAKNKIDLMYFGKQPPPNYMKSTNKDAYLDALDNVILGKKKNIRRIILYTSQNKPWIKSIVQKHKNNDRFSLAILQNNDDMPMVSAQVIDNNVSILMNLDKSVTPNKPRDIIIDSVKISLVIESYYSEMYKNSIPIITNGKVNKENESRFL